MTLDNFRCRCCGECCRIKDGIVRVSHEEVKRIASFLGMSESDFIERETELAPDRKSLMLKSRPDGSCAYLTADNLCRINQVKPDKCRTFPFEWTNPDSVTVCPALATGIISIPAIQTISKSDMKTYGVSFDGFQPSCGWPMYKNVEEKLIPHLKCEVERWRVRRDAAARERVALKGLKPDIDGLVKSRAGLVAKLQSPISGGETKVDDVISMGVKEAEIKTDGTWPELFSWLTEAATPLGQIAIFYKYACERADFNLDCYQNCLESTETDIRFWTRTLELQHAYWVFEKAEFKYKTKLCRGLVKTLVDYIGDCREQLGRFDDEESRTSALYEDIEWLLKEAEADLAYYRQIKADIAAVGVEEALRLSSRKITQPTTDIDNGGALNQP